MTVARSHGLYGVNFASTVIGGITQQSISLASEIGRDITSGDLYPGHQSVRSQVSAANWTTKAIAAAFGQCPILGTDIGGLAGGLKLYAQKREQGNQREAGSTHRTYTINEGIVVNGVLSVPNQGDAELTQRAVVIYDGSNLPIVETDATALPSAAADVERFTLGPVTLESLSFDHITNLAVDFGINVSMLAADSDLYHTFGSIQSIAPVVTLSGIDAEWLKSSKIPFAGLALTHANSKIFLRQRKEGNAFWADVNVPSKHIKITLDGLATIETEFDASGNDNGTVSMSIPCRFDATNAPLVITVAQDIA